jgi:hypothetical protein
MCFEEEDWGYPSVTLSVEGVFVGELEIVNHMVFACPLSHFTCGALERRWGGEELFYVGRSLFKWLFAIQTLVATRLVGQSLVGRPGQSRHRGAM